jgi:hypothetical protein
MQINRVPGQPSDGRYDTRLQRPPSFAHLYMKLQPVLNTSAQPVLKQYCCIVASQIGPLPDTCDCAVGMLSLNS